MIAGASDGVGEVRHLAIHHVRTQLAVNRDILRQPAAELKQKPDPLLNARAAPGPAAALQHATWNGATVYLEYHLRATTHPNEPPVASPETNDGEKGLPMNRNDRSAGLVTLLAVALAAAAFAQTPSSRPIIYPSRGQSAEQQAKDETACYGWASQYTGFDPAKSLADLHAQQAQAQRQTQQVQQAAQQQANASADAPARGAVGGAAVGAIGGAIGGNAGKGAAIGATVGLVSGAAARRQRALDAAHQQEQQQAQINAEQAQLQAASQHNRAFQTCMQGRGYAMSY